MNKLKKGRYGEYTVILKLLELGFEIYPSLVDDRGVDMIIRNSNGKYVEVQIKSVWQNRWFQLQTKIDKESLKKRDNFFVIGLDKDKSCWIFPSNIFFENSTYSFNKGNHIFDLNLDTKKRGSFNKRCVELKNYKDNWDLLNSL